MSRADETRVQAAAELLARHRLGGLSFGGFPEDLRPRDEDEAYVIQGALHQILARAGRGSIVGWKIGCTSLTMQGLPRDRPAGCRWNYTERPCITTIACFRHLDHVRPGVECEIAVRLGRDLQLGRGSFWARISRGGRRSVMAAIEIVDDRYANWPGSRAPNARRGRLLRRCLCARKRAARLARDRPCHVRRPE